MGDMGAAGRPTSLLTGDDVINCSPASVRCSKLDGTAVVVTVVSCEVDGGWTRDCLVGEVLA